jgi:hypothetical protein
MFSIYLMLRVHTQAGTREVIRALYGRMRPDARRHAHRAARHSIIREMLGHHARAQDLHHKATTC